MSHMQITLVAGVQKRTKDRKAGEAKDKWLHDSALVKGIFEITGRAVNVTYLKVSS